MKEKTRVRPFLIALPALLLLLVFNVWPVVSSVIMSFQQYSPKGGIFGSELVGLKNYADLFGSYYIWRLLRNAVSACVGPGIIVTAFGFLAAFCLHRFPNRALKTAALTVLLIPAFIPTSVLAGILIDLVASDGFITANIISFGENGAAYNALASPDGYVFVYYLAQIVTGLFWPALLGLLTLESGGGTKKLACAMLAYFLLRLTTLLVSDSELLLCLYNPLVYEKADTFGSFVYRKGLQEANYGFSCAVSVICFVPQLIINLLVFRRIGRLSLRRSLADSISDKRQSGGAAPLGLINDSSLEPLSILARECLVEGNPLSPDSADSVKKTLILVSSLPPIAIGGVLLWLNKKLPLSAWVGHIKR